MNYNIDKIKADNFYSELYDKYGLDYVIEAGYYEESSNTRANVADLTRCTPISFLQEKYSKRNSEKKQCVLLTTGSFAPFHDGHLEMITRAKSNCETLGYEVLGGYIAPDHDEYINAKLNKEALNINQRIYLINEKIKNIDWLAIEPWPGVFLKNTLNFTTIYERLDNYIKHYVADDIDIIYICGGDNARFCMTFQNKGKCIIIDRPGYNDIVKNYIHLVNDRNILYAFNNNKMSSTMVRRAGYKLPKPVEKLYLRIHTEPTNERRIIRSNKIISLLKENFKDIVYQYQYDQEKIFKTLPENILSLDSILVNEHKFEISRAYDYFGIKSLGFINRPGSKSFNEQIKELKLKNVILFDDDIHTGKTINFVREKLEENNINVNGIFVFNKSNSIAEEIADLRDFYFGEENCGLVIKDLDYTNKYSRYPYIYPFVCPYIRASIKNPIEFSAKVWEINKEFWNGIHFGNFNTCLYYENKLKKLL